MNFTEVVNAVLEKVKRPDKLVLARIQVNAAITHYAAMLDNARDLVESIYTSADPASSTMIVPLTSFPRFRKFDWVRHTGTRQYITPLDSRLLCSTVDIRDKYYIAGSSLNINFSKDVQNFEYSYYAWPPTLSDASPEYWQLEGNWIAVMEKACAKLFRDIGDAENSAAAERDAAIAFMAFKGDITRGTF